MKISKETSEAFSRAAELLAADIANSIKKDMAKARVYAMSVDEISARVGKAISDLANRDTHVGDEL